MIKYILPRFLEDALEYDRARNYWNDLWGTLDIAQRDLHGWQTPWLKTGPEELRDGNPIFSAVSETMRKGIRVIQGPPNGNDRDFVAWVDTFGGAPDDPDSITELVISCVLSPVTSAKAFDFMAQWVSGLSTILPVTVALYPVVNGNALYAAAA